MQISVNKIGDSITGNYGEKSFGIPFSKDTYEAMKELETKLEEVESVEDANSILEEFEKLTKVDSKEMIEKYCEDIHINRETGKYYLKVGDVVSSVAMPEYLTDFIKESMDKGIEVSPIIKLWVRWLRNPILRKYSPEKQEDFSARLAYYITATYTNSELVQELVEQGLSEEVAEERATRNQVKITKEGLLCTYKSSEEVLHKYELDEEGNKNKVDRYPNKSSIDDVTGLVTYEESMPATVEERIFQPAVMGQSGDAFFCEGSNGSDKKGHVIKVGCTHRLSDWSKVNTDNNISCVKGLHVGNIDYIRGYQGAGTETHNVFVDPMQIGAIMNDSSGAIRCLQYFVHSSFAGVNGSIYHSSNYAKQTDQQWEEMKAEIVKDFGEFQEVQDALVKKETDELNSL